MVTLVIPAAIFYATGSAHVGWWLGAPWSAVPVLTGLALIALGLRLMAKTISLFHGPGRGTLAPWDPTQRLVVLGIYRNVRNPMISGVFCILLGESVVLGSLPVAGWFLFFVLVNMVYIPLLEERQLADRFGAAYLLYKRHVPRWIPRRHAWEPPAAEQGG
jgi:protein-S-isoprenylcysteine O-methyltransferase Ste14